MKHLNKIRSILYGAASILLANVIRQDDWGFTFYVAIIFIIGALILPPLITFMSDKKKDRYYE